jgi:MoaA/NifB/PqqE/SkfB family radical SAM enzyme
MPEPELSINEMDALFTNLKKLGITQVNLIGGEIFLNKEKIWKIIEK